MVSIAQNKSPCITPSAFTTRDFQTSAALALPATECDRGILQAAKERYQRQLAWNRRSITFGLFLGVAAVALVCSVGDLAAFWPLTLAAAAELVFVPWYTTLACRRLHRLIAVIDLDLEEGFVRDGKGRVRRLFGVCPVVEDCTTRTLRLPVAGRVAFAGMRPGARVKYRFASRSRLVLSIEPEAGPEVGRPPHEVGRCSPRHIRWDFYCEPNLQSPPQMNQPLMTLMGTDG